MHREEARFEGRRFAGSAFWIASRTILRCTPSFLATPRTVPTPSKYSRRIFSNSSTLAFQSNRQPLPAGGTRLEQSYRFLFYLVGQIRWPRVGQNSWPNARMTRGYTNQNITESTKRDKASLSSLPQKPKKTRGMSVPHPGSGILRLLDLSNTPPPGNVKRFSRGRPHSKANCSSERLFPWLGIRTRSATCG